LGFSDWFKTREQAVPEGVPTPDQTRKLALYKYDTCTYSLRVMRAIERLGLEVEFRDVRLDREHRSALQARTGRTMVPCLIIDDTHLFESVDILAWLEAYAKRVEEQPLR
jgi:glutathione S-transferase